MPGIAALCLTTVLTGFAAVAGVAGASTNNDDYLIPKGQPLFVLLRRADREPPAGSKPDVFTPADVGADPVAGQVIRLFSNPSGYPHLTLRLHQFVKNYVAQTREKDSAAQSQVTEPTYFFLSDRRGGFPGQGFWLTTDGKSLRDMTTIPYIDIKVGPRAVTAESSVNQIFPHELGHILVRELTGKRERKAFNGVHFVTVRSDPWMAFDEGWGTHFQPAAIDASRSPALLERRRHPVLSLEDPWYRRFADEQVSGCWFCPANLGFLLWQGTREQQLRDRALVENYFSREVTLPAVLASDQRPAYEAQMYRDVIPPSLRSRLKNGSQMLASEGVVATFFYRLVSDERLQKTYREPNFYRPFLLPGKSVNWEQTPPQILFTPRENVYLKTFAVMAASVSWQIPDGRAPLLQFVQGYMERFPDEAPHVLGVFLNVTGGTTVEKPPTAGAAEQSSLLQLRDRILAGQIRLDARLGPPLWLANRKAKVGYGVYRHLGFMLPSYNFDLNAADESDLRTVPGISAALAKSIVDGRERRGFFKSIEDLSTVPGVTGEILEEFRGMQALLRDKLSKQKIREDDTGSANWILLLFLSSYVLAALFQVLGLVLFAALIYVLLLRLLPRVKRSQQTDDGKRRRIRRAARFIRPGLGPAVLAFLLSLGFYFAGLSLTPWLMAATAPVFWFVFAFVRGLRRKAIPLTLKGSMYTLAGWVLVFAITGLAY